MWIGHCGFKEKHDCSNPLSIKILNFDDFIEKRQSLIIPNICKAVLINPIDPVYPTLVILIQPICLAGFTSKKLLLQWKELEALCDRYIQIGPCVGHSSDGDSRRRMLMNAAIASMNRPGALNIMTIREIADYEIPYRNQAISYLNVPKEINDQDYLHNIKKLVNPVINSSKALEIHGFPITMNLLRIVKNHSSTVETSLSGYLLDRKDHQNFRSARVIFSSKVIEAIEKKLKLKN